MCTELNNSHNPLPALRALAKFGVAKSAATYIQNNYWTVPDNYLNLFGTYYLLNWQAAYFKDSMVDGTIERNGVIYQVIYHRTNPVEIAKCKKNVMLSFRELKRDYEVQPVVLVSIDKRGN